MCNDDIVKENNEDDKEDSLKIEEDASLEVWIMKTAQIHKKILWI